MSAESYKFVLYSHDAMGIGHVRRNLRIAQALASADFNGRSAEVLLVCGIVEAAALQLPPHVDCLTLPSLRKLDNGRYVSRRWDVSDAAIVALRAATIQAAVEAFEPDAVVIDKLPQGVAGELAPTVRSLQPRRQRGECRLILGLRDVLDAPEAVRSEWEQNGTPQAIEQWFDAVWIYGDPRVYDTIAQYRFSLAITAKSRFTGYLAGPVAEVRPNHTRRSGGKILCLVGGGEDGAALAEAFAELQFQDGTGGVIVTGPFMPVAAKRRLAEAAAAAAAAARNSQLHVLDFVADCGALLRDADRVIAMGGYNTVCELLAASKPALIVPRVAPRSEQWIRARRLAEMGLLSVVHPDQLSPAVLQRWLDDPNPPAPTSRDQINFHGEQRVAELMSQLLGGSGATSGREDADSPGRLIHAAS